jgi:hypothetical protein
MDHPSQSTDIISEEPGQFYADKPNRDERKRSHKRSRHDTKQQLKRNWQEYVETNELPEDGDL